MKNYQSNYTSNSDVAYSNMYNVGDRSEKAKKVIAVLDDYFENTTSLKLLDMSSSTGIMANNFSHYFSEVIGIDIDKKAVLFAKKQEHSNNVKFFEMDALNTSFSDASFDVAVCNQMYEHVPDPVRLMKEIYRILKPGGICYFGATNKFKIIETHYGKLPFLSWLPKRIGNYYLRVLGKGDYYYENLMSLSQLRQLVTSFEVLDYTGKIIKDTKKYNCVNSLPPRSIQQLIALFVVNYAYYFCPGYVWLLKKPGK